MVNLQSIYRMLCIVPLLAVCGSAFGHTDLDIQIEELSRQIVLSNDDPELYLERGNVYRRHGDWALAASDLDRARFLDANLSLIDWYEGRLALDSGDNAKANKLFSLYINSHPEYAPAWHLRAMARVGLNEYLFASEDFARSITLSDHPGPPLYRSLVLSLFAAGEVYEQSAVLAVKKGLGQFPREISLLGLGVDLLLMKPDLEQALALMIRIPKRSQALAQWRFRSASRACIAGNRETAISGFSALLTPTAENGFRSSGTWQFSQQELEKLIGQPDPETCISAVRELLARQLP